jgi:hypothetical protein
LRSEIFDSSGPSGEDCPYLRTRAQISGGKQAEIGFYRKTSQAKETFYDRLSFNVIQRAYIGAYGRARWGQKNGRAEVRVQSEEAKADDIIAIGFGCLYVPGVRCQWVDADGNYRRPTQGDRRGISKSGHGD